MLKLASMPCEVIFASHSCCTMYPGLMFFNHKKIPEDRAINISSLSEEMSSYSSPSSASVSEGRQWKIAYAWRFDKSCRIEEVIVGHSAPQDGEQREHLLP